MKKAISLGTGHFNIDGDYDEDILCPYCNLRQTDPGIDVKKECEGCGKIFYLNTN